MMHNELTRVECDVRGHLLLSWMEEIGMLARLSRVSIM